MSKDEKEGKDERFGYALIWVVHRFTQRTCYTTTSFDIPSAHQANATRPAHDSTLSPIYTECTSNQDVEKRQNKKLMGEINCSMREGKKKMESGC